MRAPAFKDSLKDNLKNLSVPEIDQAALKEKAGEVAGQGAAFLSEKWEKTSDKPAAVLVTVGGALALTTLLSIVNTIDKIPLLGGAVELVGLGATAWFVYRYYTVGADRDELLSSVKAFLAKIYDGK